MSAIVLTAGLWRALGSAEFGIYVVIQSFSALSLSLNPAISATTMRFIAAARGGDNGGAGERIRSILTSAVFAVLASGALFTLAAWLLKAPLHSMLFGEASPGSDVVNAAIVLAVAAVSLQQIDALFGAALKGLEHFGAQGGFELVARLFVTSAMVLAAFASGTIVTVLSVQLAAVAAAGFCRALLVSRLVPGGGLFCRIQLRDMKPVLGYGGWMWLNATATAAFGTVDRIVINRVLGSAAAAEYHVFAQVLQLIHYIPASVLAFTFPMLSRMLSQSAGQMAEARRLYRRIFWLAAICGVAGAGLLLLLGRPLLHMISGHPFTALPAAYIALAAVFALLTLNIGPYYLLLAAGRSRTVALITAASIGLALVMLVPMINVAQLNGAAYSRGVYAVGTLLLILLAHRMLSDENRRGV